MTTYLRWPTIFAATLANACGGVAETDAGADVENEAEMRVDAASDDVFPEACAPLGRGPGFDSCCRGAYCNGNCSPDSFGTSPCGCGNFEQGGCPASTGCCWHRNWFACELPADCVTCTRVGTGAGIESCCYNGPYALYCRGRCGDPKDNNMWCTCGSLDPYVPTIVDGCPWDQVCCPLPDGGSYCVSDAGTCQ